MSSIIKFSKLNPAVITPKQQTELAAGYDVHAYLEKPILIKRGSIEVIPTGLKVQLEKGTMLSESWKTPGPGLLLNMELPW